MDDRDFELLKLDVARQSVESYDRILSSLYDEVDAMQKAIEALKVRREKANVEVVRIERDQFDWDDKVESEGDEMN